MTKHKPTAEQIKARPFTRQWTYSAAGYVRAMRPITKNDQVRTAR